MIIEKVVGGEVFLRKEISEKEWRKIRRLLLRRRRGEPVFYIVGKREFYGIELKVKRGVFIPRPETENLVDEVLKGARDYEEPKIADIGTGCGAVAIALAKNLPRATIYATDISKRAIKLARENIKRLGLKNIKLLEGDLLEPLPGRVDIIAANLPYIRDDEIEGLPREVKEYEPPESYRGGEDGLLLIRRLLEEAPSHLTERGSIFLEISSTIKEDALRTAKMIFPTKKVEVLSNVLSIKPL